MSANVGALSQSENSGIRKIINQLEAYEYSLFKLERERAENFLKKDDFEECEYDDIKKNSRTDIVAAKLITENLNHLENEIKAAIVAEPENIHAWMNKSMFHAMKEDVQEANAAYEKALELHEVQAAQLLSKIEYAYWIAERDRSDEMRKKSFVLFEEVLKDISHIQAEDPASVIQNLCNFSYLMVLVRYFKSPGIVDVSQEQKERYLKRIFDLLTSMANENTDPSKQRVWIWLAEIHESSNINRLPKFKLCLQELRKLTMFQGFEDLSYKVCLRRIESFVERGTVHLKTVARAAKSALHYAYTQSGKERKMYLKKALDFAERSLASDKRIYMADEAAAKASLNLWAMEFLENNREVFQAENEDLYECTKVEEKQELYRLCTGPFLVKDDNEKTKQYLRCAVSHLQQLEETQSSSPHRTCTLARIMYNLGFYDNKQIEDLLHKAITCFSVDRRDKDLVDCRTTLGRLYEKTGQLKKAVDVYERATENQGLKKLQEIARKRIKCLRWSGQ